MIDQADVVVIGAGSFGSSTAYHLAQLGMRNVVLLDRFEPGSQTSPRAAGLTSQVRSTDTLTKLARRSVQKLERFETETGQPLRFAQSGALKIARRPEHVEQLEREVARARSLGVPLDFISPNAARDLCPVLEDRGILAMTFNPTDCNVEPSQLPIGYARAAQELGVTVLGNTPATGLVLGPGGVEKVVTPRGEIRTPLVVDAAGAWVRVVADLLGVRLPVVPTRHQLFITEPLDGVTPAMPIARVIDANVYIRHERGGLMLGGYEPNPKQYDLAALGPNFQIADLDLDIGVLRGLAKAVEEQFPVFQRPDLKIAEHRGGLPTMTVDDRYILGPVPGVRGFWLLTGCCVGGLSISPGLGEALAQWIVGGEPPMDLSEIGIQRFADRELPEDELRQLCLEAYANHYAANGGGGWTAPSGRR
ncbi:MAG: FAD-binding oxidoreductase [Chloroflexi bacterium]|nr:FAD-binding oxidoreductase [Chloroflexota bacterium]